MNKKLFLSMAAASMLLVTSCSEDNLGGNFKPEGSDANVTVGVTLPSNIQSRAYSDGTTAQKLQYALYEGDAATGLTLMDGFTKTNETINIKTTVNLKLVTGHKYGMVFFASDATAPYTVDFTNGGANDGATLTVDYSNVKANDETLDAFYAYVEFAVDGDKQVEAKLYRPFAQINVGTNDFKEAADLGFAPTFSNMEVSNVYSGMNLVTGAVDETTAAKVTFNYNNIAGTGDVEKETFPVATYEYLDMVYVLADPEKELVDVTFAYATDENGAGEKTRTVTNVPVQRNYQTNIYGQVLTSNVDLIVEIVPEYNEPDYNINVEGVDFDAQSNTFTVQNADGLAWIAKQVNSTTPHASVVAQKVGYVNQAVFVGQTIELAEDIDLSGVNWQPIGYEANPSTVRGFGGTFDGKNHTISNVSVSVTGTSNAGFFGAVSYGTVKDLNLVNVDIKGNYKAGALAGDAQGAIIENVTVQGGTVTSTPHLNDKGVYDDANNVGGLVGYLNGQPTEASIKNCKVDGLTVTAFRKVGGLVGVITCDDDANPHTAFVVVTGNTVTNTAVIADMSETGYDGYPTRVPDAGQIYGWLSYNESRVDKDKIEIQENTAGDDVTITVIQQKATSQDQLLEALVGAEEGETIYLGEGTFTPPVGSAISGKTIDGMGVAVLDATNTQAAQWSNVTLKNMTVKSGTTNYRGFQHSSNLKFEKVTFDGLLFWYCDYGQFDNCTFIQSVGSAYCLWTYGAQELVFNDCKFNTAGGRAVNVYGENNLTGKLEYTFNNCEFKSESVSEGKAAIEIDSNNKYVVMINDCTSEGFDKGNNSGNDLWNDKNGGAGKIVVKVNGETVLE